MKTAEQMATEIVAAIITLMAVHEAVWHRRQAEDIWVQPKQDAIKIIAEALERASGQYRETSTATPRNRGI